MSEAQEAVVGMYRLGRPGGMYLENCHDGIPKGVEVTAFILNIQLYSVQFSSEYLHSKKGEDEYEEKEEEEQG